MLQSGAQAGIAVAKRPPVLTENARCTVVKDGSNTAGAKDDPRGVKRSYAEVEHEAYSWGSSVTASTDQNGTQKLLGNSGPHPQEVFCRGLFQRAGVTVDQQCGSHLLLSGDSFGKILRNPESDGAEEAEIRAEILNGVRQLLRDESEIDCLVRLCALLKEKNTALIERAIHRRGVSECAELLEETLQVEARGGMLTKDGRRRTPGGVFLRLLQDRIPREDKRFIWDEQNREQRRLKRQRIRRQRTAEAELWSQRANTDVDVPPAPVQQEVAQPACDELEPGELDAAEIYALDEQLK
ncbi:hypothetical protein, conserved [Eimeria praecox]|uniref:Phosphorylated adapter RNA export protein n=1 Tax=Eimeria praecox TaxID=51316 RepID=U6GJB5_9EIME|nr:hypothetical protein, conserved [Eimeria praecox]